MVVAIAFVIGAAFGSARAGRRGGDRLDMLHYGATHGIAFALAAFLAIVLARHFEAI